MVEAKEIEALERDFKNVNANIAGDETRQATKDIKVEEDVHSDDERMEVQMNEEKFVKEDSVGLNIGNVQIEKRMEEVPKKVDLITKDAKTKEGKDTREEEEDENMKLNIN